MTLTANVLSTKMTIKCQKKSKRSWAIIIKNIFEIDICRLSFVFEKKTVVKLDLENDFI